VLAIIRRMDLDADARLTMEEFIEGIKPSEPYSRMLKRERSRSIERAAHHSRKGSSSFYLPKDEINFYEGQNDVIRTQAMDRSWRQLSGSKSPLKLRSKFKVHSFATPTTRRSEKVTLNAVKAHYTPKNNVRSQKKKKSLKKKKVVG